MAASVSASFINQVLFSVLQRYSSERMRKRSAELAAELADFNKQLRAIMEKKKAKAKIESLSPAPVPSFQAAMHAEKISSTMPDSPTVSAASTESEVSSPATMTMVPESSDDALSPEMEASGPDSEMARAIRALELLLPDEKVKA